MITNYNNYYIKTLSETICYCHRSLLFTENFGLNKIIMPVFNSQEVFCNLYNVDFCIRRLLSNNIEVNKTTILWLENTFFMDNFLHVLTQSLILRKQFSLETPPHLGTLNNILDFLVILIEDITRFTKNKNLDSNESYDDLIINFYKEKFEIYKESSLRKKFFVTYINPILFYNLRYTQKLRQCLSETGLRHLCHLCKKEFDKQSIDKQSLYIKNHSKDDFIVIPYMNEKFTELNFFKNLMHNN